MIKMCFPIWSAVITDPVPACETSGRRPHISVFGRDYDTPDGTCIRDYIHIVDLCQAHLLAMQQLMNGGGSAVYNLGNGNGFSVQEVITIARRELKWQPVYAKLEAIVEHAWNWERRRNS